MIICNYFNVNCNLFSLIHFFRNIWLNGDTDFFQQIVIILIECHIVMLMTPTGFFRLFHVKSKTECINKYKSNNPTKILKNQKY